MVSRPKAAGNDRLPANTGDRAGDYAALLSQLKQRISSARLRAAVSVNRELILLYWDIGRDILARQRDEGWGARVVDRLATDLRQAFPEMTGLSARNLKYMRGFAEAYPDPEFVQQVVALLPWGHNVRLLEATKSAPEREWYARQAIANGWSRSVLIHQIESGLFARKGGALTNFSRTLPAEQSDLAQQIIKDPYIFDFLSLSLEISERELERRLVEHLRSFFLELGKGFSFVGNQYHLEVGGQDYYIDLLFYHLRLRCFVVIELKVEDFKPEFAGKMSFYLSAVDDQLRHTDDLPTIGIIMCKGRNEAIVEYALRDAGKPMGVAEYRLSPTLPKRLRHDLPTIEELERGFAPISIFKLRIDIQRAAEELAKAHGIQIGWVPDLFAILTEVRRHGVVLPNADRFQQAVSVLGKAVMGLDVDTASLEEAMNIANQFLAELNSAKD